MTEARRRIVVVGAGLAGAATAYHLAMSSRDDILILEKEEVPGSQASGRNAAMIRQVVAPAEIAALAVAGARFCAEDPARFRFDRTGSLLLGDADGLDALRRELTRGGALPDSTTPTEASEIPAFVPYLEGTPARSALSTPDDGVVDVAGLLQFYVSEAARSGARLRTGVEVVDFGVRDGRIASVVTSEGEEPADVVVNAAGAWAARLAASAGAASIPMRPLKRHLVYTGPLRDIRPETPFVWDIANDWYVRPESGGLLLCACDEKEAAPGDHAVDETVTDALREKLQAFAPRLADVPVARVWSGLRTFAPDRSFVIGWDPVLTGFFWVAGLGGHGVTTSFGVGREAARLIVHPEATGGAFSPARFS